MSNLAEAIEWDLRKNVFDIMPFGVAVLSFDGDVLYRNKKMNDIFTKQNICNLCSSTKKKHSSCMLSTIPRIGATKQFETNTPKGKIKIYQHAILMGGKPVIVEFFQVCT